MSSLKEPKTQNGPTYAATASGAPYAGDEYYGEDRGAGWLYFAATMLGRAGLGFGIEVASLGALAQFAFMQSYPCRHSRP